MKKIATILGLVLVSYTVVAEEVKSPCKAEVHRGQSVTGKPYILSTINLESAAYGGFKGDYENKSFGNFKVLAKIPPWDESQVIVDVIQTKNSTLSEDNKKLYGIETFGANLSLVVPYSEKPIILNVNIGHSGMVDGGTYTTINVTCVKP